MKYRDGIIHTPILEESPRIHIIYIAIQGKDVPMICYILSHATKFFDAKQNYDNVAGLIFNKHKLKHGQMSCLKILIEQKFINAIAPNPQE